MRSLVKASDEAEVRSAEIVAGTAVWFSDASDHVASSNEDAAGIWQIPAGLILAVADGMGGGPSGAEAAAIAIDALDEALAESLEPGAIRPAILDAFESANAAIVAHGIGAGTTLVAVEIVEGVARCYHAGDSGALIVGQRGRIRFQSVHHSPVGFGVASGMLDQTETHTHPERHLLSNHVGSKEMSIDIGPPVSLSAFDTLILASDGVLDNIRQELLIDEIRRGSLVKAAGKLRKLTRAAMEGEIPGMPARPDDATAILFRGSRVGGRGSK